MAAMTQAGHRGTRAIAGLVAVIAVAVGLATLAPSSFYPWIKAFHVMAVIAWMAGMLYLPRLFVYHCDAEPGSVQSETFKVMERRLLRAIINPAMIVTWLAGLYLAWAGKGYLAPWLYHKLLLVLILSGVHGFFSRCVRDFAADR